jgi:hypothetical protein
MSVDPSRRFTDREVAIVLKKASEIDDSAGSGAAGGLSLEDLTGIAKEVGISAEAIGRAIGDLDHNRRMGPAWAGAPLVRKAVHAVPGELNKEAVARLVRLVDERADTAGTISEALGSVRWTSSDRMRSNLVSITRERGETRIQVVEKAAPRIRRVFHFLPAAWGMMIATPIIGSIGIGVGGALVGVGLGIAVGAAAGRAAWTMLSASSARRVERLAGALAEEAREASAAGLLAAGSAENERIR